MTGRSAFELKTYKKYIDGKGNARVWPSQPAAVCVYQTCPTQVRSCNAT